MPPPLLMWAGQLQMPERRGVGAQLVGDQQFRRETLLLEQLVHQPQRRPGIASTLNQHVENLALMVDGSPRYIRSPPIRTTISSRCQRSLGRGRRARCGRVREPTKQDSCSMSCGRFALGDLKRMQWMLDHWFEITTTVLLTIIAINTLDGKWNNSTIVEQLSDLIRSFSSRARREAVLRSHSPSERHLEISDNGHAQP